jgi:hypothetical protein
MDEERAASDDLIALREYDRITAKKEETTIVAHSGKPWMGNWLNWETPPDLTNTYLGFSVHVNSNRFTGCSQFKITG